VKNVSFLLETFSKRLHFDDLVEPEGFHPKFYAIVVAFVVQKN